jgi:hypothetical protein
MFSDRLAEPSEEDGKSPGGVLYVVPAGEVEEKLLHLCSSIIQNISLHPDNRSEMSKGVEDN